MLAAGWLDDANNIATQITSTGKLAAAALVVVFMLVAYAAKRTLGAVVAAGIVGGVVLWVVNNTDVLKQKTTDTLNNTGTGTTPALGEMPPYGTVTLSDGRTVRFA